MLNIFLFVVFSLASVLCFADAAGGLGADVSFLLGFDWPAKPESITDYVLYALGVVGAAAALLRILVAITAVTPSKKDDAYVGKAVKFVAVLTVWLERISLGLDADRSRKPS